MAAKKPIKKGKKLGSTKLQRAAMKRYALQRVVATRPVGAQ